MKRRIPIKKELRAQLIRERGITCQSCHVETYDNIHHIDEDPSNNEPENLKLLCWHCHRNVHQYDERPFLEDYDSDVFGGRIMTANEIEYMIRRPKILAKIINLGDGSALRLIAE